MRYAITILALAFVFAMPAIADGDITECKDIEEQQPIFYHTVVENGWGAGLLYWYGAKGFYGEDFPEVISKELGLEDWRDAVDQCPITNSDAWHWAMEHYMDQVDEKSFTKEYLPRFLVINAFHLLEGGDSVGCDFFDSYEVAKLKYLYYQKAEEFKNFGACLYYWRCIEALNLPLYDWLRLCWHEEPNCRLKGHVLQKIFDLWTEIEIQHRDG